MSAPAAAPATLVARALTVHRGDTVVLDDVSLTIGPGARIGVIGPNGVGKSTLLRVLAGLTVPDHGTVSLLPPTATVGYLAQEPERVPGETVSAYVRRRSGVAGAEQALDDAAEALGRGDPGADDRYGAALEQFLALGAADLDARLGAQLADLGLPPSLAERETTTLSGGQAARMALAALLLARFDIALLDEPTNDLDFEGLERLEAHLADRPGAVVIVSHDRAFLERTISAVVEIDEHTHRASRFDGGWQAFLDERATARRHAERDYETYLSQRDRLRARAQTQREWALQGTAKVRRSGETDKFIRHHRTQTSERLAAKARRTEAALDRLEVVDKPWEGWELRMEIADAPRGGDVVVDLEGVVVDRGRFRLGPLSLAVHAGERVALLGPNGSGKTTLLEVVLGTIEPSAGRCRVGPSVRVGVLDQRRALGPTVAAAGGAGPDDGGAPASLARLFQDATGLERAEARSLLAKFGLGADHVDRDVTTLSPGERTRAELARFMATGVNALVLDEPTNHLDLPAIEQLSQALGTFGGTLLVVTHDRQLLDELDLTRVLELDEGQLVDDRITG